MTTTPYLLSLFVAATASFCAPASAQSLALSYQLDASEHAPRLAVFNSGCVGPKSIASCGTNDALGRFSHAMPGDDDVARLLAPVQRSGGWQSAPSKGEVDAIPFLGEASRAASSDGRVSADTEFNVKVGERLRVREDIERRFYDAAQQARFNRNLINALGFEVIVPIQSKLRQSADPELPQSAY